MKGKEFTRSRWGVGEGWHRGSLGGEGDGRQGWKAWGEVAPGLAFLWGEGFPDLRLVEEGGAFTGGKVGEAMEALDPFPTGFLGQLMVAIQDLLEFFSFRGRETFQGTLGTWVGIFEQLIPGGDEGGMCG